MSKLNQIELKEATLVCSLMALPGGGGGVSDGRHLVVEDHRLKDGQDYGGGNQRGVDGEAQSFQLLLIGHGVFVITFDITFTFRKEAVEIVFCLM